MKTRPLKTWKRGFSRFSDMEKQGSDIYFGGFSQMKRFPFFYTLSNWFVPFYLGHPALESVRKKLGENKFLQILFNSGPFCDSDKYSFALAMGSIIDKIPDSVKEMLNSGEAVLGPVASNIDKESTTFLRRSYLQDLYRFFRLYPYRQDFRNPFENFSSVSGGPGFFFHQFTVSENTFEEICVEFGALPLQTRVSAIGIPVAQCLCLQQ
jgi:hypothetical protein